MKIQPILIVAGICLSQLAADAQNFKSYTSNARKAAPAQASAGGNTQRAKQGGSRIPARPPESAYYKHIAPGDIVANSNNSGQTQTTPGHTVKGKAAAKVKQKSEPVTASYGNYSTSSTGSQRHF